MENFLFYFKILLFDIVFSIILVLILTIARFADADGYSSFMKEYSVYSKFDAKLSVVLDEDLSEG